jgi:hypothetical protein
MDWETKLVKTYFLLCKYSWILETCNERFSNNNTPKFTDIEAATIYLVCTTDDLKLKHKKAIYTYANRHLRDWFPDLPKYEAFNYRINKLGECFRYLAIYINQDILFKHTDYQNNIMELLGDSMPIMMAKGPRAIRAINARVATEIAKHGYCSTKKTFYHGLKLHGFGLMASEDKLPPFLTTLSSAADHDYEVCKNEVLPRLCNAICYLDSAYFDKKIKLFINKNTMSQLWLLKKGNEDKNIYLLIKNY